MKSRGLGDSLEKVFKATGVSALVEKTADLLGIEDCGCIRRRDNLNQSFPYNTSHTSQFVSQDIIDFTPGVYILLDDLTITKDTSEYHFSKGNRILINNNNPLIEDFVRLIKIKILERDESW